MTADGCGGGDYRAQQPGKPKPPGNPVPERDDPDDRQPAKEPPQPIPIPRPEPPPAPLQ